MGLQFFYKQRQTSIGCVWYYNFGPIQVMFPAYVGGIRQNILKKLSACIPQRDL